MVGIKVSVVFHDGSSVNDAYYVSGSEITTIKDSKLRSMWRRIRQSGNLVRAFVKFADKDLMEFNAMELDLLAKGQFTGHEPFV